MFAAIQAGMKLLLFLLSSLLLVSCGPVARRTAVSGPPPLSAKPRRGAAEADKDEAGETPGQATAFYLLKRTGGGELPVEKLLDAKRHRATMPAYSVAERRFVSDTSVETSRAAANVGAWQPAGPGNIGGRTRSLVIRPDNPSIMYAGAVGGGVWKTTDSGNTWNPQTDLLPSIGISALAMDPNNPDTLYAGTGEFYSGDTRGDSIRGAGIYKTTNGGANWTQLGSTNIQDFYYVNKLVVSPNNSKNVYAATWFGVYASTDGGNTWRLVLDESGQNQPGCQDLVIRSDQTKDYLFASCAFTGYDNPAIYRNTDASGSGKWQAVFTATNMGRTSLALAPSNQSIIYAVASSSEDGNYNNGLLGVFRSMNNGDSGSWTTQVTNQDPNFLNTILFSNPSDVTQDICNGGQKDFSSNQGDYDNTIAVDPVNPNTVWVGGIDLFRSDDGGQNWGIAAFWEANAPQFAHADNHAIVFAPGYNGTDNQTLFVSNDGGIYYTNNALAPPATGSQEACYPYPTSIAWANLNNGYAVTQFYNGAVYPGAAAYLGGSQDNDTIRGSDASGVNGWAIAAYTGDGGFVAIDPADPNTFYYTSYNLSIQKTTDGGTSSTSATTGITEKSDNFLFIAPLNMDPENSSRLYTGGRTLWRTGNAAKSWTAASAAVPASGGSISAIAISPSDPNHVAFATENGFVHSSKAALAAGRTTVWPSSQPRSGFVSSLAFDPADPTILYATYSQYKQKPSQSHVYKSTDGGVTWKGIDGSGATGIPDIPVFSLMIDPQNSSNLYLGSDIGLFVSIDGGATWARDSNPFADAVTEILVLDRSAGQTNLVAFTHGRGVWKTALPGSGAPCQYTLSSKGASANGIEFPAIGSTATFNVATAAGCAWSALSSNTDFQVSSPAAGTGRGSFSVSSAYVNTNPRPDVTQVTVQNQAITISQDAPLVAAGNDTVASAFSLGVPPVVVIEDATGATESAGDPVHSCTKSADFKTVWFQLKTPSAGKVTVTFYDENPDGSDAGSVVTLYPFTNGKAGAEFGCFVYPQSSTPSNGGSFF